MSDLKSVTIPENVKKLLLEDLDFTHKMIKETIENHNIVESPLVYDYNTILIKLDIISKQNNLKELKDLFWETPTIKPFKIDKSKPLTLVDDFEELKGVPSKFWSPIELMEKQLIPCYKRMEKDGKVLSPSIIANHLYALSLSFHIQHKDHFQAKDEFYDSLLDLCQKQTSGQTQES